MGKHRAEPMSADHGETRWGVGAALAMTNGILGGVQFVYLTTLSVAVTSIAAATSVAVAGLVLALRR
jgi:hypothetical protein